MKKEELGVRVAAYCADIPVGGLIFLWYNHIIFQKDIPYWKFVVLTIPILYLTSVKSTNKFVRPIMSLLLIVCLIAQTLAWLNLIVLPLIKQ